MGFFWPSGNIKFEVSLMTPNRWSLDDTVIMIGMVVKFSALLGLNLLAGEYFIFCNCFFFGGSAISSAFSGFLKANFLNPINYGT
jgi:hypothetical protein